LKTPAIRSARLGAASRTEAVVIALKKNLLNV